MGGGPSESEIFKRVCMSNIESILLYLFVFIFSYILMRFGMKARSRLLIFLSLGVIVLLGVLRYGLGGDYPSYLELYGYYSQGNEHNIHASSYADNVEPVISWLAKLSYELTRTPLLYFGIPWIATVFLVYLGLRRLLKQCTPEQLSLVWFTLLPIITALGFNQIRQTLAAAILFFAYSYLLQPKRTKALRYVVLASIAILTHFSALFIIVIYLLFNKASYGSFNQFKKRMSWLIFVGISITTILIISSISLKGILFSQFPESRYLEEFYRLMLMGSDATGLLFGVIDVRPENLIILLIFLIPIVLFFRHKYVGDGRIITYCALGLIMSYLSLFILNGERLSQYFIFFAPIAMCSMEKGRYNIKLVYACIVFSVIMFFGWQTVTRYNTIFHRDVDLNLVAQRRYRALFSQTVCLLRPGECRDFELYDQIDMSDKVYYGQDELWRLK